MTIAAPTRRATGSIGRIALPATLAAVLLILAACSNAGPGRIPSYRYLEQNAPSSSDFQPRNSLPP
jgi:hypothetical protein